MNRLNAHKILVVDDEKETLNTFVALFDEDFSLLTASSGKEALELLKKNGDVAAIVIDQRMPEMTGLELMLQIKGEFPDIVRVLFTGFSDAAVHQSIVNQADIFKYIRKPYDEAPVKEILEQCVNKYLEDKEKKKALSRTMALIQEKTARAMENYTSWISHHVNNGMQTVYTFVSMAQEKFKNGDPGEASFAKLAKVYVEQVNAIIKTLHQIYAEGLAGFSKVSLGTLLRFEDAALGEKIKSKKIRLKMNVHDSDLQLMANPTAIQEALRKLVENSVEASSDGAAIEVSAAPHQSDGYPAVMFEVRDFGKGIEKEMKEKLFYPFLKLGSNTMQPKGLGLSFVQAVVARHGGDIMVESKVGVGTTITFSLPVIQEQAETSDAESLSDIKKMFGK